MAFDHKLLSRAMARSATAMLIFLGAYTVSTAQFSYRSIALYGNSEIVARHSDLPEVRELYETRDYERFIQAFTNRGFVHLTEQGFHLLLHPDSIVANASLVQAQLVSMALTSGNGVVQIENLTDQQRRFLGGLMRYTPTAVEALSRGRGTISLSAEVHFGLEQSGVRSRASMPQSLGFNIESPRNSPTSSTPKQLDLSDEVRITKWDCRLLELIFSGDPLLAHEAYSNLMSAYFAEIKEERDQIVADLVPMLEEVIGESLSRGGLNLNSLRGGQPLPSDFQDTLARNRDVFSLMSPITDEERALNIRSGILKSLTIGFFYTYEGGSGQRIGEYSSGFTVPLTLRD